MRPMSSLLILIIGLCFARDSPCSQETHTEVFRFQGHHFCSFTHRVRPEILKGLKPIKQRCPNGEGYTVAPPVPASCLQA